MPGTTLGDLARLVSGELRGPDALVIRSAARLERATVGEITFLDHPRLLERLAESPAAAVVLTAELAAQLSAFTTKPALVVPSPKSAFGQIARHFRPPFAHPPVGISPQAIVDPTAELAADVQVHPLAVIGPDVQIEAGTVIHSGVRILGRCRIGRHVTVFPNAVLYEDTLVGDRCTIHAGAVIGAYGFGYDTVQGKHIRGEQLGFVQLDEDVEVGANTTIDRGTFGPTVIGAGTKIDNLVMVAHNCQIGRHNLICSQVGIAGSSQTGDYVIMAGQVGVPDHARVGHRAIVGAKSGILRDVPDDTRVVGIPATPEREQMAIQAALVKLPQMRKQLRKLQRTVDTLSELAQEVSSERAACASVDAVKRQEAA